MKSISHDAIEKHSGLEPECEFLTAKEVAELFFQGKLKYYRVLRMTRNGDLPAIRQGKSYIYLRSALETWAVKIFNKSNLEHKKTDCKM